MSSSGTSSKQIMLSVNCLLLELFDVSTKYLFLECVSTTNFSGVASVKVDINIGKHRIKIILAIVTARTTAHFLVLIVRASSKFTAMTNYFCNWRIKDVNKFP